LAEAGLGAALGAGGLARAAGLSWDVSARILSQVVQRAA
jgi:hypothetical protein